MKKYCVIFDLDGTLCDVTHRRQYVATKPRNWDAWNTGLVNDKPVEPVGIVYSALNAYCDDDIQIFIVSGRSDDYRQQTEKWLLDNRFPYDSLYMRKYQDHRDDTIVKSEIADEIEKTHHIIAVFDDRQKVVNMWQQRGIFVFDVGQGKSNF
jgi:phosphoglycolate phosphatase-like HAD superfamily hydrolase